LSAENKDTYALSLSLTHTARLVTKGFDEDESDVGHLPWSDSHQI